MGVISVFHRPTEAKRVPRAMDGQPGSHEWTVPDVGTAITRKIAQVAVLTEQVRVRFSEIARGQAPSTVVWAGSE